MPSPLSFLQAAVSSKRGSLAAPSFFTDNNDLQLLLVEDDNKTLAYSLAMDTTYSLVSSSSSLSCRGCGFSEKNACRCCKVAMLVTRSQNTSDQGGQSPHRKRNNNEGDIPFPLWCYQEGTNNDVAGYDRDHLEVLNHIHIKYVNTIQDVIRYLAYVPSLPKHMMPSSGIFIMGLGDLVTQQMELTHVLSLLSDTGCVLGNLVGDSSNSTTLVATLNQQIYSSLPYSVYKQLGFSDIAAIQSNMSNSGTSCELVFEDQKAFASSRASFSFTQTDEDTIVWSI